MTRAKPKLVARYSVPVCSLSEQKVIADKLDKLLAQVNNLKARLDTIPAILKRFRQSVLAAAVSGGLTEGWRQTHKKKQWVFRPLGEHPVDVQIGPFGSLLHKSDYVHGGVPLVNPMHINDGAVTPSQSMTLTEGKAKELSRYSLRVGDVVLGRRGEMGRSAVIQGSQPLLCGTGSLFLRPDVSRISSCFLSLFLRSPKAVYALEAGSAGSTMVNLNQKVLKGVPYPDVELEEQEEIVRRVDQLFAFADQIEQQVKNAQARVDKLTQSILAKAFRGELTAEWRAAHPELISGEHSAAALLERIKAEKAKQTPAKTRRGGRKATVTP
ncbi:restriction endonuclease subunit S [Halomonas sp.]|uniref:restriction endonuclease subunit S n=1 Tax=Halomonas sp. TaxID=1486246 RepID=UPI002615BA2C|nr:restriction endonuclease subunit S [Halomonas sp.]